MENDHFLEIVFGVDVAVSDFFGNQMKTREFFESVDGQIHETKEKCLKRDAELASLQEEAENHIRLIMNAVGPISFKFDKISNLVHEMSAKFSPQEIEAILLKSRSVE